MHLTCAFKSSSISKRITLNKHFRTNRLAVYWYAKFEMKCEMFSSVRATLNLRLRRVVTSVSYGYYASSIFLLFLYSLKRFWTLFANRILSEGAHQYISKKKNLFSGQVDLLKLFQTRPFRLLEFPIFLFSRVNRVNITELQRRV